MRLKELLKVGGEVFLIELSHDGLEQNARSLDYLGKLRCLPSGSVPEALEISARDGEPLGIAFENVHSDGDFWFLLPYPHAQAARRQTERMVGELLRSGVVAEIKRRKADASKFRAAVREYLSVSLVERALCDCTKDNEPPSFAANGERDRQLTRLLMGLARKHGFEPGEIDALEICCGNGMSTVPLRQVFRSVLSVDNDKCAVCNGLCHGTLLPESTMVADATRLSEYGTGQYGAVAGFMLGAIYEFNRLIWRAILKQALAALNGSGFLLFTVSQREEIDFVAECFASMGIHGEVIDNRQKNTIYDSWAFFTVVKTDR